MLNKLACCLAFRFELHGNMEGLEYAIKYYRHLLILPPGAMIEVDALEVVDNLARLLAHCVRMRAGVQSDLEEEMVRILQMSAAKNPSSWHIGSIAECAGHVLIARLN
jgi:hypothetical protein